MSVMSKKLWTINDAAEFCQVKSSVVKYWLQNTNIPYIKLGKNIRFDPGDIKDWIERHKNMNGFVKDDDLRMII